MSSIILYIYISIHIICITLIPIYKCVIFYSEALFNTTETSTLLKTGKPNNITNNTTGNIQYVIQLT